MTKRLKFVTAEARYKKISPRLLQAQGYWTDTWTPEALLSDPGVSWYFLMSGKVVVAECTVTIRDIDGHKYHQIDDVLVNEKYRGRGYCTELIKTVMKYYKQTYKGTAEVIRVICFTDDIPACRCYEKALGGEGSIFPPTAEGKERRVFVVPL